MKKLIRAAGLGRLKSVKTAFRNHTHWKGWRCGSIRAKSDKEVTRLSGLALAVIEHVTVNLRPEAIKPNDHFTRPNPSTVCVAVTSYLQSYVQGAVGPGGLIA
jgi:hypothetical protein